MSWTFKTRVGRARSLEEKDNKPGLPTTAKSVPKSMLRSSSRVALPQTAKQVTQIANRQTEILQICVTVKNHASRFQAKHFGKPMCEQSQPNTQNYTVDLVKHLIINISEISFTQRFDDSMSSFSSEKRIKFDNLIYTVQGDKT